MTTNHDQNKTSAKDFFLYLLVFITLYIVTINLICLWFEYITLWFPQSFYFNPASMIRWYVASLIVSFPIYLVLTIYLRRYAKRIPEKNDLAIKKWLSYFTLFVAALILIGRLTTLIYNLLSDTILISTILKSLVLFIIILAIFAYYLKDLRRSLNRGQALAFLWLSILITIVTLAVGIYFLKISDLIAVTSQRGHNTIKIPYCPKKSLPVTTAEDKAIQITVNNYANQMYCSIGKNCLEKWNDHGTTKFSIAWQSCRGYSQGGSTFICKTIRHKVCCSPLGSNQLNCT